MRMLFPIVSGWPYVLQYSRCSLKTRRSGEGDARNVTSTHQGQNLFASSCKGRCHTSSRIRCQLVRMSSRYASRCHRREHPPTSKARLVRVLLCFSYLILSHSHTHCLLLSFLVSHTLILTLSYSHIVYLSYFWGGSLRGGTSVPTTRFV